MFPEIYQTAQILYNKKQPLIEAYLWEQFQNNGMQEHHLESANKFLGNDIQAGLILGDMEFLPAEMDWIKSLLESHDIPGDLLHITWSSISKPYKKILAKPASRSSAR